ncbi:hypothetical protein PBAL39_01382 [Pedobacter sp. BAL39]|uniref:hypothetical protein n=1 Tax=Pedobacter sp. BAL39 TaxID=391596 RepID=UPI00015594B3|nr:hypothetical protein [Pedobacter sp. BAL39]EDM38225.1 hypothetical protein PBAL39_01382 [Pedobacter sp. BAL39]
MDSKKISNLSGIFFQTGFLLISIITLTLFISSLTFFLHGGMGGWQLPLATVLAVGLHYLVFRSEDGGQAHFLTVCGLSFLIIILSILVGGYFYDTSFDGQAYHMEAMIQMKRGWNPYWEYLPDSVNQAIWVNHYAKGMETVQAAFYCTFGNIETGKAINIWIWVSSFLFTSSLLLNFRALSFRKSLFISGLLACNPIVINQLLSYYVDGPLGALILCLVICCIYIIRKAEFKYLLLLGILIVVLVNLKFTAILYLAVFIGGFLIWLLFRKDYLITRKLFFWSLGAGILAIVIGFNPYITNTVNFKHPLYPLMGKDKVDIIYELNLPTGFEHKSGLERFITATFSRTDNIYPNSIYRPQYKIPFTFNKTDICYAPMVDARLGGFGPWFSGIVIFSFALLLLLCFKGIKDAFFRNMMLLFLLIVVAVVVMPESWWARYVPQLWALPIILLICAELALKNRFIYFRRFIYLLIIGNLMFNAPMVIFNMILTSTINYQIKSLKTSSGPVDVDFGASASNRIRFEENHIPYRLKSLVKLEGEAKEYIAGSQTQFIIPEDVDRKIPVPFLVRMTEGVLPFMWEYYGR